MKIAVASEGKMVTEHFGHCESFNIFEVENNRIVKKLRKIQIYKCYLDNKLD